MYTHISPRWTHRDGEGGEGRPSRPARRARVRDFKDKVYSFFESDTLFLE